MKLSKFLIFIFSIYICFSFSSLLFASTVSSQKTIKISSKNNATLVAMVNIENQKIVSQKDNNFMLSFDLSNGKGLQSGVKYGVELVPENAHYIADQKVYDESMTLYENSTVHKEITYVAPAGFNGDYDLYVLSNNESGFPFAIASLGKIKLTSSKEAVDIVNDTCYLKINDGKHHTITEGVYVNKDESINLICDVVNHSNLPISVNPSFETRYFSMYGKVAPQSEVKDEPISFVKGEKKTISLALPVGLIPQFYTLKVNLNGINASSNDVYVHYVVNGTSAIIQKLSLDKDIYKKGDNGTLSLIWSAVSGDLSNSDKHPTILPPLTMNISIKGNDGKDCISPISKPLVRDYDNPQTGIPFTVLKDCLNPNTSITITDNKGNVLDQKGFLFKTSPNETPKNNTSKYYVIIFIILIVLIFSFYLIKRNKKVNVISN